MALYKTTLQKANAALNKIWTTYWTAKVTYSFTQKKTYLQAPTPNAIEVAK